MTIDNTFALSLIDSIESKGHELIDQANADLAGKPTNVVAIGKRRIRYAEAHLLELLWVLKSAAGVPHPINNKVLHPLYHEAMDTINAVEVVIDEARAQRLPFTPSVSLWSTDQATEALFHARIAVRHVLIHLDRALDLAHGRIAARPEGAAMPAMSTVG